MQLDESLWDRPCWFIMRKAERDCAKVPVSETGSESVKRKTMMKTKALMLTSCVMLVCVQGYAAMVPGAKVKDWPANADKHVISIERKAANEAEKTLIATAEAAETESDNWWILGVDRQPLMKSNVKVPYALTGEVVDYYAARVKQYQTKACRSFMEPSSRLAYTAAVAHQDSVTLAGKTYANVHVVTLKLSFDSNFTEDATMGINVMKRRTIVLDAAGKVLAVDGDGIGWGAQLAM
jgi:hypothetical protein